ncbi:rhodanese-like domain-containing protein [Oscillibacter sp.]|uniref:rhodanese-like domain-containing protein n=1 Tax=Oscillibacter sp. TaxID=1945593 RepID=UPI00289AD9C2|nr:rhodanese-like domain-containing protein [Oscillibacter sp.]
MKKITAILSLSLLFLLSACSPSEPSASGSGSEDVFPEPVKITAEEAHERMTTGTPVVVDVRTAGEYAEGHIPGAILLPNEEIGAEPPAQLPVLDAEILIYCRSGNRSAQAATKLSDMGYTNLSDFGGIIDWPYETENGDYQIVETAGTLSSFAAWDLNGVPVDQRIFADYKLTLINIWATFCGPCLREMPDLGQLSADYADRGVRVVGIVVDVPQTSGAFSPDMVQTARDLVEQTGANYLHLLPSADLIAAKLSGVSSVPETIFVNDKGELVGQSYVGARSGEEWSKIIDSLLETAE